MNQHFSIVLPVRNGGDLVKDCVQSVLDQRYANFEFIILDNNSNDGTLEWIQSLNDSRIKIISSGKDLTMAENWKRVRDIRKNEYFTMIGHDDLLDPDYLSCMDKLIDARPGLDLYQAHFRFIDAKGQMIRKCTPMHPYYSPGDFLQAILEHKIDTMGTGYMIRSARYDSLGGIPDYPNLLFADHALWLSLSEEKGLAVTAEELFSFRIHQSISTTTQVPAYINAFYLFLEFLIGQKQKNPVLSSVIEKSLPAFMNLYSKSLAHRLLKTAVRYRNGYTIKGFLNKCEEYSRLLAPGFKYEPGKIKSLKLAKIIDGNRLFRTFYLFVRSIYSKPIYR